MSRLTVNIENKKTEEVVLAVLQDLGLSYRLESADATDSIEKPLSRAEETMYQHLKKSFEEIKQHQEGKIKLKTIEEVLAGLS